MVQHKSLEKYIRVKAEKVIVYAVIVIRQIFLIQMKYSLQSMYNHMLGRTASVISPFYSLLPGSQANIK